MTDHANELRRYSRKIGHPAGDVPSVMLAAADEIERLAAMLEAAEKERDALRAEIEGLHVLIAAVKKQADAEFCLRVKKEEEYARLRAKIEALGKQEPTRDWWDCLIADISAIDCMYRGSPTYAHDAYWMRDHVVWMLKKRRDALPGAKGEDK